MIASSVLRNITLIVALHLQEEDLAFVGAAFIEDVVLNEVQDIVAESIQFLLDFLFVGLDQLHVSFAALLLFLPLDGGQGSPSGSF